MSNGDLPPELTADEQLRLLKTLLGSSIEDEMADLQAVGPEGVTRPLTADEQLRLIEPFLIPEGVISDPIGELTTGARFALGAGRGVTAPLAILGVPEIAEGQDLGVAGVVGELATFPISFTPFLKGASLFTKAVGLAQRAPRAARIVRGSLGFAGFEAAATREPGKRLERAAVGGAVGAAGELLLLKLAKAHRARMGTGEAGLGPVEAAARKADIDPAVLLLELGLRPDLLESMGLEEATKMAESLVSKGVTDLPIAAARFAKRAHPQVIVPVRPNDVDRIVKAVQKEWSGVRHMAPKELNGVVDILFSESKIPVETAIATLQEYGVSAEAARKAVPKFLDEGKRIGYDGWKEIFDSIPKGERPTLIVKSGETLPGGKLFGKFTGAPLRARMRLGKFGDPTIPIPEGIFRELQNTEIYIAESAPFKVSVAMHEFGHFIGYRRVLRQLAKEGASIQAAEARLPVYNLSDFLGEDIKLFKRLVGLNELNTSLDGKALNIFRNELREMTRHTIVEVSNHSKRRLRDIQKELGTTGRANLKGADVLIKKDPKYYLRDNELIIRGYELMFINPRLARKVAPHATAMLKRIAQDESKHLVAMLTPQTTKVLAATMRLRSKPTKILERSALALSDAQLAQYKKQRIYSGMKVFVQGRPREALFVESRPAARVPAPPKGAPARAEEIYTLSDPMTNQTFRIRSSLVHKPILSEIVARQSGIMNRVRVAMNRPLEALGVTFRDEATNGLRPASIDVSDYLVVNQSFDTWLKELTPSKSFLSEIESSTSLKHGEALSILSDMGRPGALFNDNGMITVLTRDGRTIASSSEILINPGVGELATEGIIPVGRVDPFTGNMVRGRASLVWNDRVGSRMEIPYKDVAASIARQNGAFERDVPFISKLIEEEAGVRWDKLVDPRSVKAAERASKAASVVEDDIETAARRTNLRAEINPNGDYVVRTADGERLGVFNTEEDALDYISRTGQDEITEFVDRGAMPTGSGDKAGFGGGAAPPPAGGQIDSDDILRGFAGIEDGITTHSIKQGPTGRGARAREFARKSPTASRLVTAFATNMEDWSKASQQWLKEAGFDLKPFTRIFLPAQNVILSIERRYATKELVLLNGRSMQEQVVLVENLTRKFAREFRGQPGRRKLAKEALKNTARSSTILSKAEVETEMAKLMGRSMTREELAAAEAMDRAGFAELIPKFQNHSRSYVRQRNLEIQGLRVARRAELKVEKLSKAELNRIDAQAATIEDYIGGLGWSANQGQAFRSIHEALTKLKTFNSGAVYRHATAGTETRAEWMVRKGFSKQQTKLADEMQRSYEAAYTEVGLEARPFVGGFVPMLEGFTKASSPNIIKDSMFQDFPEAMKWFSMGVKDGEFSLYSLDPIRTPTKHWRNLQMRRHFDPIRPSIDAELLAIRDVARDTRTHRIMNEFVDEITGKPHESFRHIQRAFESAARHLGLDLVGTETRHAIDIMTYLVYGATIPFRPALIARNYFQVWQMVAPRIGHEFFYEGLKRAGSDGGYQSAVNGLALITNRVPIEFGERAVTQELNHLPITLRRFVDKGFNWYRKADDYGRAVAFHGMRARIEKHWIEYQAGKISYQKFFERAKVLTFSDQDIEIFDALLKGRRLPVGVAEEIPGTGIEAGKNYLGRVLANETIFRYGHANHPAGWGSAYGRLFGQFGTWPVQYKDYLLNGMTRGTARDRRRFLVSHFGINAAMLAGGAEAGINLWSWVSFPSLQYTGGPFVDMGMDIMNVIGGSEQERRMAFKSLRRSWDPFTDLGVLWVPGSYALSDGVNAFEGGVTVQTIPKMLGFRFFDPGEKTFMDQLIADR